MNDNTIDDDAGAAERSAFPGASQATANTTAISVFYGGIWNTFSQALPQLFSLIVSVAAARYLGPEGMGRQSFIAFTMISLTEFFSEGLKEGLMRFVGESQGAGRPADVRGLVAWIGRLQIAGAIIAGAVLVMAGIAGASPREAWLLAGITAMLTAVRGVPWGVLVGSQRWRDASLVGLVTGLVGMPVTIAVLAVGGGITGMFAVEAAASAICLAWVGVLARRVLVRLPPGHNLAPDLRRRATRYMTLATLTTLTTFIVWQRSEFFFLSAYSTNREIAFYSISFAAVSGLSLATSALANALSPAFATLHGGLARGRIRSGYWRSQRLLWIISLPVTAVAVVLGPELLRVLYGDAYRQAGPVLVIMASILPLLTVMGVASALLIGLGLRGAALVAEAIGGLVTIVLNFLLVPLHAATGAAVADIGGQLVAVVPILVYSSQMVKPVEIDVGAILRTAAASAVAGVATWRVSLVIHGVGGLLVAGTAFMVSFVLLAIILRVVPRRDRAWLTVVSEGLGDPLSRLVTRMTNGSRPPVDTRAPTPASGPSRIVRPGLGSRIPVPERDPGRGFGCNVCGRPASSRASMPSGDGEPPLLRLVVYSDALERGGAERALGYLLEEIDPRIQVTVLGVDPGVVAWIASRRPGAAEVLVPPVRHKGQLRPVIAHLRAVRRLKPDVLHASLNSPWSGQYGILAGLLNPGTRVVAVENALVASNRRVQKAIKRLLSRALAAHVAVGEYSARELELLIGLKTGSLMTIRNGVPDMPTQPRQPRAGQLVIGTVSRVGRQKGVDLIVRALPRLPDTTAVIVGEGPMLAEVRALASRLGVADRLQTPGFDPNPRWRLATFDVFVLPTQTETALPLAIIEAMLAELPVVATRIGSISENFLEGETGFLVAPDDLDALVHALRRLTHDPGLRKHMGATGRSFALERFSVSAMVRAYEDLYREVTVVGTDGSRRQG